MGMFHLFQSRKSENAVNDLSARILDFIGRNEHLYFRAITVLTIIVLFLAAEQFQDLVLFVSLGLLGGGIYYRRKGDVVDIGTFIGAGIGLGVFIIYFLVRSAANLFLS